MSQRVFFKRKRLSGFLWFRGFRMPNMWAVFCLCGDMVVLMFCATEERNVPFMGFKESVFKLSVVLR